MKIERAVKAIFLTVIAVVVVLILSGCSKKQKETTTLFFVYCGGTQWTEVFNPIVEAFQVRYPNIKVKTLLIGGDYYGKVMTMMAGNTAPDIMWMGQGFVGFASRGAFLDLTSRIQKEIDVDKYYSQIVDLYRYNGKYYGFPYSIDMDMFFYNKTLFDKAGLPYPNEKWTIRELVDNAQKLTLRDKNGRVQQYGFVGGYDLGPFGASILNDDKTKSTLDKPEAVEALKFNIDLEQKYKVSQVGGTGTQVGGTGPGLSSDMLFQTGRVAMFRGWTWNLPDFRKKITAFDWDITLVPIARKRSHWASSGGYAISSQTRHPEEAWTFFKFLISPEAQRITSTITIPACKDVALEIVKNHTGPPENMKAFLEAIPYLQPLPRVKALDKIVERYFFAMEEAKIGKKTPESAFKEAAREIDGMLR